jgi:phosphodiesterase/alkaline phosphatase D-like protein
VATGEPSSSAVTFWSRLDTDRLRSGARLVVARDEGLNQVVANTIVPTGRGINGTLKARIGDLDPREEYFYKWISGTDESPVGRTLTAPARGRPSA